MLNAAQLIILDEGRPMRPPYCILKADSRLLDKGEAISPQTDGFTGTAPDVGAIENGLPFRVPSANREE